MKLGTCIISKNSDVIVLLFCDAHTHTHTHTYTELSIFCNSLLTRLVAK